MPPIASAVLDPLGLYTANGEVRTTVVPAWRPTGDPDRLRARVARGASSQGKAGVVDAASRRAVLYGLASGITFGVTAPLAKRLLADVAPLPLASALYLGAAIGLAA